MRFSKRDNLEKAKNYVYRLVSIRPRSEKEIRLKLREKGYGEGIAEETVCFFKEKGIIDDLKFAKAWVDSRMRLKPKGDILLSYELKNKGISEDITKRVLKDARTGMSEKEQVLAIITDLVDKNRGLSGLKRKKKIYDYLARRGFGYDIIEDSLNEVLGAK